MELDKRIRNIEASIWVRYAATAITYYSPEKTFIYIRFRKNSLFLNIFTDQRTIDGVKNIRSHENWGKLTIKSERELPSAVSAIKTSYEIMKEAVENNKNTGWNALTPSGRLGLNSED